MKNQKTSLVAILAIFLTSFFSCQKQEKLNESEVFTIYQKNKSGKKISSATDKQVIEDWLKDYDHNIKANDNTTLETISKNLNYNDLRTETKENGDNIIIIPVNNIVKQQLNLNAKYLNLDVNSILNLMIMQSKEGKLKWASIVAFLPAEGKKQSKLAERTLQNIVNNETVADDGMFKFIDIKGRLAYQLEYKKGKLYSWGSPVRHKKSSDKAGKKDNKSSVSVAPVECWDVLLETTYHLPDGSTYTTEVYLFTICDNEGGGGDPPSNPNVPGGGGSSTEEEPSQEIETEEGFSTGLGTFTAYDMSSDPTSLDPIEIPEDAQVMHRAAIRRFMSRVVKAIISIVPEKPFVIFNANVQYYNPLMQSQCIRNVEVIGSTYPYGHVTIDPMRQTGSISWSYDLHYRYSYFMNHPTETFQKSVNKQGRVSAWQVGLNEW